MYELYFLGFIRLWNGDTISVVQMLYIPATNLQFMFIEMMQNQSLGQDDHYRRRRSIELMSEETDRANSSLSNQKLVEILELVNQPYDAGDPPFKTIEFRQDLTSPQSHQANHPGNFRSDQYLPIHNDPNGNEHAVQLNRASLDNQLHLTTPPPPSKPIEFEDFELDQMNMIEGRSAIQLDRTSEDELVPSLGPILPQIDIHPQISDHSLNHKMDIEQEGREFIAPLSANIQTGNQASSGSKKARIQARAPVFQKIKKPRDLRKYSGTFKRTIKKWILRWIRTHTGECEKFVRLFCKNFVQRKNNGDQYRAQVSGKQSINEVNLTKLLLKTKQLTGKPMTDIWASLAPIMKEDTKSIPKFKAYAYLLQDYTAKIARIESRNILTLSSTAEDIRKEWRKGKNEKK